MNHLIIGDVNNRGVKTGCGIKLEDLPRKDASVPYKLRQHITCEKCEAKANKIANMRGEQ
jgi:hypothetical protein